MKHYAGVALRMLIIAVAVFSGASARAQTSGSVSGTVKDPAGSVIPDTAVILRNTATGAEQNAVANAQGFYAFSTVPVGMYELDTFLPGFKPYKRTGLVIDVGTKLEVDIVLELGEQTETVTVTQNAIQVETESTQMGDVITGPIMTSVGLNGRSFTDLLALQPGIVPMSTQTGDSVVMAGVTTAITPSGALNPGNQSINGQREDANGFLVNGSDVKEGMNGGTAIIPDLDSISEFRVLTNNFDAEYGNYAGGIVTAITKSGTNQIHGNAFEFLRNTNLDAKGFFDLKRDVYDQNQFGGTIGGPIKKNKVFFFADYQGTRTNEGLDSGQVSVPTLAERGVGTEGHGADFTDTAIPATGNCPAIPAFNTATTAVVNKVPACVVTPETVQGAGLAQQLQNSLGYSVFSGEPYYTSGCTSATCVFPGAIIPQSAWTVPSPESVAVHSCAQ